MKRSATRIICLIMAGLMLAGLITAIVVAFI